MDLKYTARTIRDIEVEKKRPITDVIGVYSMENIVYLVQKGLACDEETAFTKIEEFLALGNDTTEIYLRVMESLQRDGFLPKALQINDLRAKMQEKVASL